MLYVQGLFILFLLVISSFSCKREDPVCFGCTNPEAINYSPGANHDDGSCIYAEKKQRALIIEQTATWCSACPSAGKFVHGVADEYNGDAIIIAMHGEMDDPMKADCFSSFRSDRYCNVYPAFFIADERVFLTPDAVHDSINIILTRGQVEASVNFIAFRNDSVLNIKTRTKFFINPDTDFYLSVYIMENNIFGGTGSGVYEQINGGANYLHNNVLRAAMTKTDFYGEIINNNYTVKGTIIDKEYIFNLKQQWNFNNLYVICVLWKYIPTNVPVTYKFVNITANSINTILSY